MTRLAIMMLVAALPIAGLAAQDAERPASPEGEVATQVNGKWIEISYGRPILRGRTNVFGSGADYGVKVNDGAPVWRAGANRTTLLRTEAPLEIGGRRVEPGEYAVLIELKTPKEWTLIVSSQPYQPTYGPHNTTDLWGAYNYKPDRDVARAPMRVDTLPYRVDQLTWAFTDVSAAGGTMRIMWENVMAAVDFKIAS